MMMIIGIIGTVFCIAAYGLLTMEKISAHSMIFYVLNCIGAFFLLISIAHDFDWGDTGGILIEVCWIVISLLGMWKVIRSPKKDQADE